VTFVLFAVIAMAYAGSPHGLLKNGPHGGPEVADHHEDHTEYDEEGFESTSKDHVHGGMITPA